MPWWLFDGAGVSTLECDFTMNAQWYALFDRRTDLTIEMRMLCASEVEISQKVSSRRITNLLEYFQQAGGKFVSYVYRWHSAS